MGSLKEEHEKNGFYSPISIIDTSLAREYRNIVETTASKIDLLNYR